MHVVIRADASSSIGTGHIMRCLTLAKELKKRGANITLITQSLPKNLYLIANNFTDHIYEIDVSESLDNSSHVLNWQEDALSSINIVRKIAPVKLLIVDHYQLDINWEDLMRPYVEKIVVIDDLANRLHDADFLLDPNYPDDEERYKTKLPPKCKILSGTKYALLREEFQLDNFVDVKCERNRLLIQFGGADSTNITEFTVRALAPLLEKGMPCDIVVGSAYEHEEDLKSTLDEFNFPFVKLHVSVNNISTLMSCAKLAVASGGTSVWERCCVGLPSIVMAIADNQVSPLIRLEETQAIHYVGCAENVLPLDLLYTVNLYWNDSKRLEKMSIFGSKLIDGKGASRVLDVIFSDAVCYKH